MHAALLVDRTGSMGEQAGMWTETLNSVNEYIKGLKDTGDVKSVAVYAFDYHETFQFDVIRDVEIADWMPITEKDITPRGGTPLNDAVVRFASLVEAKNAEKTVAVIMTDGLENQSREATHQGAGAALDRLRAKGWQVVFLNVNFDGFAQSASYGTRVGQTMSAAPGHVMAAMHSNLIRSRAYSSHGTEISYSAEDREAAGEEKVTGKKTSS